MADNLVRRADERGFRPFDVWRGQPGLETFDVAVHAEGVWDWTLGDGFDEVVPGGGKGGVVAFC